MKYKLETYIAGKDFVKAAKAISSGEDPNIATGCLGRPLLHSRAYCLDFDGVNFLLDNGADPELLDADGRTAVEYMYTRMCFGPNFELEDLLNMAEKLDKASLGL